ncbi:MAG: hypothetical protein KC589_01495 [Nanoarchaeota archaeon]|nr:hypothetical protein [Nanoarchaeota archaeon]
MSERLLVLDNSAIIDRSQNYWWMTYLLKKQIGNFENIIIPKYVRETFDKQLDENAEDIFGIPFFKTGDKLEDIVGKYCEFKAEVEADEKLIRCYEKSNEKKYYNELFIPQNIETINSAIELAKKGFDISVASANKALINTLFNLKDEENIDIEIISPYSKSVMKDFLYNSKVKYMVTSNTLQKLREIGEQEDRSGVKLALASDLSFSKVDGQTKFTLIYDACQGEVDVSLGRPLEINIFDTDLGQLSLSHGQMRQKICANYYVSFPNKIEINHLTQATIKLLFDLKQFSHLADDNKIVKKKMDQLSRSINTFTPVRIRDGALNDFGHNKNKIDIRRREVA